MGRCQKALEHCEEHVVHIRLILREFDKAHPQTDKNLLPLADPAMPPASADSDTAVNDNNGDIPLIDAIRDALRDGQ